MTVMWAVHASTCSSMREAPNRSVLIAAAGSYTPNRTRFGVGAAQRRSSWACYVWVGTG
jgi:hypothetical protein